MRAGGWLSCMVFSPRITIPLEYWVVSAIFCRLQTSLGHERRSMPRPACTPGFDPPVMEWERGYKAERGAGMRVAGDSNKGRFSTLLLGLFGVCGLGFFC